MFLMRSWSFLEMHSKMDLGAEGRGVSPSVAPRCPLHTTLAICTVLAAAACFPEEQRKVHEELDAVIGTDRAPAFTDKKSLPRLHAFVSEAVDTYGWLFLWAPFVVLSKLDLSTNRKIIVFQPGQQYLAITGPSLAIQTSTAPTFTDKKSLPRLHAFVSEALRWRPLVPMGMPHRTTQVVVFVGTLHPLEARSDSTDRKIIVFHVTVFGNRWAISRDPDVFPDPNAFKPDRWLDTEGRVRDDLKFFVFGFGQRVCPGQHVANSSVFINTALVLWAFRLTLDRTKPLDDVPFMDGILPNEQPSWLRYYGAIRQTRVSPTFLPAEAKLSLSPRSP
ncbi:cytochrome P450 [Suillus subalutaceus]|uniref:cytochrome P450 n=1 Tax=Suillus subalutaceus TaxID=48586 RepID=UPI001B88108D|nr:cytochrome P450 [Suillus subalutaceus]KAG1813428.1 cytochrome P450 [Suillus subalutaceus]